MARLTPPPAPRHLLVRLPNPLGDAVLATPALRALRAALPRARITWAGGRAALEALDGLPGRDDVMPVVGPCARGPPAPLRAGRLWRRAGPDAVLLLPHAFSACLAAWRSGARTRVGSAWRGKRPFLTHAVELPREGGRLLPRPMTRMYLDLAAPFGAEADGRPPGLVATPFDRERAGRRLAALRPAGPPGGPLVLVNPGAAFGPSKVCPPQVLGPALRALRRVREDVRVVVVCGPGEEDLARRVAAAAGPGVPATGEAPPDVGTLKGLLALAAGMLTTDAGPRHVAEALGVPTVVLMGPTDPRWTEGGTARVLRNEAVPCLACHLEACPLPDHPCLSGLDPDRIAAAVASALGGGPGPGTG